MSEKKVDVIIVLYNHAKSIKRAIDSVLNQTFKDFKIIIVDDGSTDDSINIVNKYLPDKKIKVFYENHKGLMQTYLKGLSECSSKYIAFCDGDDYWITRDKLKRQVKYLDNNNDCGLCLTRVFTDTEYSRTPISISTDAINKRMTFDNLIAGRANIFAQSYLMRKSVFDKHINFKNFIDIGFHVWDYPIVLELIRHTRFHCLDFYSATWVKNNESVTCTRDRRRRFNYLLGNYKIKFYYIKKYGIKFSTKIFLFYRIIRDIYSTIFKRW